MPEAPIATTAGVYAEARRLLEAFAAGVTWPAIIGGAFAAAALSLTLLALGSGFGFASVSPWSRDDISSDDSGVVDRGAMAGIGCGGYITGRLRTKWVGLHTHEVFFRDTANGFLAWATASVIGAIFLAYAASSVVSGIVTTASGVASGDSHAATQSGGVSKDLTPYLVDNLYRADHPSTNRR